jgi:3-oxoadipate enol-lactonase
VSRVRLGYELTGPEDAPVVVLANSLGTTSAMWDPQVAALRERFRVLRYDHRGHGASEVPPGPYTLDDLGQDVLGLIDDLGLGRVLFCGLSLGGMVGMWLASRAPERVQRLVVCCSSARIEPASLWTDRAAKVRANGTASIAEQIVARWFTPAFGARAPEVVARAVAMLAATPDEGYAGCCEAIAAMDLRERLSAITAPTLVVAGAEDPATPLAHAEGLAAGIPEARLAVVDASHLANIEQPEPVTRLLLDHLTGHPDA